MGNYYNWHSATAGTGTYSLSSGNATASICPKGWHLPTGGTSGELSSLDIAMGGTGANQTSNTAASNRWRTFPGNFLYSGYVSGSSVYPRGSGGYFWSSTARNSGSAYGLSLSSSAVYPGTSSNLKYYGFTARCVAGV